MGNTLNTLVNGFEITVSSRTTKKYLRTEHVHNYYELHYLTKGTAEYALDGEIFHLQSGDYIFVQKELVHKTVCSTGSERLIICFADTFLDRRYSDIYKEFGAFKFLPLPLSVKIEAQELLKKLEQEYTQKAPYYLEMCSSLLQQLLLLFHRHICVSAKESHNKTIVQDAISYIEENYSTNLPLSLMAKRYAISPEHFSRTFKAVTGLGMKQYINHVRMNRAEELLETGTYSIMEIATLCGFNDSNYFSTIFKKVKGVSPCKYKKCKND